MSTLFDFDFTPLWRSTIGFDRLFDTLEQAVQFEPPENYPPYNIEKTGDETYRVSLAVPGYAPNELSVTHQPGLLVVSGRQDETRHSEYLYQGMAAGSFERRFNLAEYVEVAGARLTNGVLIVELLRNLPEAMKPRRIAIASEHLKTIEHQQAA